MSLSFLPMRSSTVKCLQPVETSLRQISNHNMIANNSPLKLRRAPRQLSGGESNYQYRRLRRQMLDPWFSKIPRGGNGTPLQYSCLENSIDRGAWQATIQGLQRVGHDWACTHTHTHTQNQETNYVSKAFCYHYFSVTHMVYVKLFSIP